MSKTKNTNTEDQILAAAKDVFQAKGMDGARMQEIADTAGINKAMLHYYYRSKQKLFEAVFNKAFKLFAPQMDMILNDENSIETKIRNFTSNYIGFIAKHPFLPNFVIHELNRNPDFIGEMAKTQGFPNLSKFKQQVDKEVEQGLLNPISSDQLFIHMLSLCVFPFVAKPLLKALTQSNNAQYDAIIEQRQTEVADFIINAIKKS